jgi:chaperonin GroES
MSLPQPLGDKVLIRPHEAPTTTESGLHVVRHGREPDVMGVIIALGMHPQDRTCPHCEQPISTPWEVAVGDTVLFPPSAGQDVAIDGDTYVILLAGDILAVLEEEPDA